MTVLLLALCLFPRSQDDAAKARALIEQLDSNSLEERDSAAAALKKLAPGSEEIDRMLARAAESGGPEVRPRAAAIRSVRFSARLVPDPEEFVARLRSANLSIRNMAVHKLSGFGAAAAPLAAELLDLDRQTAATSLTIIGKSADPRYADTVRKLLGDPQLRDLVHDTLSLLGDASVRPALLQFAQTLQDGRWVVRLGRLRHPDDVPFFGKMLRADESWRTQAALEALQGWPEAKRGLADDVLRLARLGDPLAVCVALDLRDPRLPDALKAVEPSPATLFARATLGDGSAVPHLLRFAKYGPAPRVGLWGLGVLKAPETISLAIGKRGRNETASESLRRALEGVLEEAEIYNPSDGAQRQRVRWVGRPASYPTEMAIWALGEVGVAEAQARLADMLRDDDERVRHAACAALGRLKAREAVPELVKLLDDALAFASFPPVPVPPAEGADSWRVFRALSQPLPVAGWSQVREAAAGALESIIGERFEGTIEERARAWKSWAARRGEK
jgi:HEAT repeat protein